MKLSHKLMMVSAAVLMGVSPVVGMANSASVQAAPIAHAKGVHNTYGKNSRVKMTKTMKFVDRYGKKTSKTATKGGHYTIWNVKNINGEVYYSIQTDWIPAAATEGTVTYKSGKTTYTLKSNGKKVVTSTSTAKSTKKAAKKTTKKVVKKATKKTVKKSESKKDSKKTTTKKSSAKKTAKKTTSKKSSKIKVVKISMKKKAYVYDNNGKRVKNYLGTSYIGKDVTVKGLGTKTIKGTKYYALKPNHYYVKASDVTVK